MGTIPFTVVMYSDVSGLLHEEGDGNNFVLLSSSGGQWSAGVGVL